MSITTFFLLFLIGALAGILSGFVGVGGGLIIIPLLMLFIGLSQHEAQGTSLAVMLPPIGILAALNYSKSGFVKWEYALVISLFFIIGGYFSSKWAVNMEPQLLKKVFGLILFIGGVKLMLGK